MRIPLNGLILLLVLSIVASGSNALPLPLRIGADSNGGSRFAGCIARVSLYHRVLSEGEIARLAGAGPCTQVKLRGMIAGWTLDTPLRGAYANAVAGGPAAQSQGVIARETVDKVAAARMNDGYLQVDGIAQVDSAAPFSVEAWVHPDADGAHGGRIVDQITAGGSDGWLLDTYPGNSLRLIVGANQQSVRQPLASATWSHIALTVDLNGHSLLYVNGKPVDAPDNEQGVVFTGSATGPNRPLTLWYRRPATRWTQALVLGNGRIGAMVYGGVRHEKIALNDDTLWSGEPTDTIPPQANKALGEVRRLLLAGKNREAHDLVAAKMLGPFFQSYLPLGDLNLDFGDVDHADNYRRDLDISHGVARVQYRSGDITYTREMFVSQPDQALVMRLTADKPHALSFELSLNSLLHHTCSADTDSVVMVGRCPKYLDAYTGKPTQWDDAPNGKGMRFETRARIASTDGVVNASTDKLSVQGASDVLITLVTATSYNGFDHSPSSQGCDPAQLCDRYQSALAHKSYQQLLTAHTADFARLFDRVAIDLGHGQLQLPTDARIRAYTAATDPGLAGLYCQFGRYLLISGSRPGTQPLNLQGIWNDQLVAPWASNWTLNCNAQINYWAVESTNLAECHLPLVQMTREISVDGARVARQIYGASGWMTHHNADLWRAATPVSGDPLWAIFQVGGAWLCQHVWEHYAFGGDEQYLRSVWPLLKGAAQYFLDSMIEEPAHGWLVTAPDTNFENYFRKPSGETAAVCMGPTGSMQIIRELFQNCLKASQVLHTDDDFAARVRSALPRLAPMQVSARTGQLQEWIEDWDHASPANGQMLSLWGLICGTQIDPQATPQLATAIRKSLDDRKPWQTYVGSWTGSFSSNAFARLGDGDMAEMVLSKHLARVVNPNMTANFEQMSDWQIDGNMGQTAAIVEMLLQSQDGAIHLLPALPKAWPSGHVQGLRARGGFEVSMDWKQNQLQRATIRSQRGGACTVRYRDKSVTITVQAAKSAVVRFR